MNKKSNKNKMSKMSKISNIVAGTIAVVISFSFCLVYAVRLNSVPLWIIIMGNFGCLAFDYYKSITEGEDLL